MVVCFLELLVELRQQLVEQLVVLFVQVLLVFVLVLELLLLIEVVIHLLLLLKHLLLLHLLLEVVNLVFERCDKREQLKLFLPICAVIFGWGLFLGLMGVHHLTPDMPGLTASLLPTITAARVE